MTDTWKKTAILGGDRRMCGAAVRLARQGHTVAVWGIDGEIAADTVAHLADWKAAIYGAQVILLPIPVSGDGVRMKTSAEVELRFTHLLDSVTPNQRIYGGRLPPAFKAMADERGLHLEDYAASELFAVRNAIPTAEGALELALHALPVTLCGCKAAVIGHGRIGRVLAERLRALGADVTVAARKTIDLCWIEALGYQPLKIETVEGVSSLCRLKDCRVIFNTAPHWLFTRAVLEALRSDVCLIDLASSPGGIDPQAALELGTQVIRAPGLPGKCAPMTAGEIIADTVIDLLAREGVRMA